VGSDLPARDVGAHDGATYDQRSGDARGDQGSDGPSASDLAALDAKGDVGLPVDVGADSPSPDVLSSPDAPSGPLTVSKLHDTCTNPLEIDVSSLSNNRVDFWLDTTGAAQDFAMGPCSPFPDVVVAIRNAVGMRNIRCAGGTGTGSYTYGHTNYPSCSATITSFYQSSCNGGSTSLPHPAPDYVLVFCRDPALGPALITLSVSP
jgi:hypothetical protein